MALSQPRDIELPLLFEIDALGGEATPEQLYPRITAHLPPFANAELSENISSGSNRWINRIQWARQKLVLNGELYREPRGIWRITPKGKQRLASQKIAAPSAYSFVFEKGVVVRAGRKPAPQPIHEERAKIELAPSAPPPPPGSLHEQMQSKLEEIGRILGKFAQKELRVGHFEYDTVWRATAQLPPSHVFEVQDKGNLDSALVKLKHASDIWPCQLFLVVTGEKDREKAQELLAEHFTGAFHEIADKTVILSPEDIEALYKVFSQYKDIIRKWR